jgi:hypothetical protein
MHLPLFEFLCVNFARELPSCIHVVLDPVFAIKPCNGAFAFIFKEADQECSWENVQNL